MKRFLMVVAAVVALSATALAQDGVPLAFEGRVTLGKAHGDQAISWRPTGALVLDLGRLDLGLSVTDDSQWDSTQEIEFFVPIELYTFDWSEGQRSLKLETYIGTDLAQGTAFESRTLTFGALYSSVKLKGFSPLIRAQMKNYDWVNGAGDKTSLTSWAVQAGFRKSI